MKQALKWWATLDIVTKIQLTHKHMGVHELASMLTDEQILTIHKAWKDSK